jgi:phosphate uptake regulator
MDVRQHIQKLRLRLFEMSRVSQRTIDYSTKTSKFNYLELYMYFRDVRRELDDCHREITRLSQQLLAMEQISTSDRIFTLTAKRIANCLREACVKARDVFQGTMRLRESSQFLECTNFLKVSDTVNAMVRLCVVALFKKEVGHAKTVHYCYCREWHQVAEHLLTSETGTELGIARDLDEIASQANQIAHAIVHWLEATNSEPEFDTRKSWRGVRESLPFIYSPALS